MRTIAVLAGGAGTRLASVTDGPKVMLEVAGRPFIDHKLDECVALGADQVVLLLGDRADVVMEHVGFGSKYGRLVFSVVDGPERLGTGGALKHAAGLLGTQSWVTYGDSLCPADLDAAERHATRVGCPAVMVVVHNAGRWQPSNTTILDGKVTGYSNDSEKHRWIDYGYLLLPTAALTANREAAFDLSVVIEQLIERRELAAFEVGGRFHDIGTPDAAAATDEWLRSAR